MPEDQKEETTNKVLETKIDGLAKLTDERFNNIKETLIRIETSTHAFVSKAELEEVKKDFNQSIKRIEDGFINHNAADIVSFGGLDKGQRELRDTVKTWGGALIIIGIILPILVQLAFHFIFKK